MIVVTGAAGFIGSHIIKGLNARGITSIIAVDDLTEGRKFKNLAACQYDDYIDYEDFLLQIKSKLSFIEPIRAIFHQGACSNTTEWNGRYLMKNNYEYTKVLFHYCLDYKIPLIYASSAAVYGQDKLFKESYNNLLPLNIYGYSKWRFDQYMLSHCHRAKSQIVGLRYFNVYGPQEQHKERMASVAFHFMNQLFRSDVICLFEGSHGYEDGEHCRDFIYIDDVVDVNLWFLDHPKKSGIFNVGTGNARSFNELANCIIQYHGHGRIQYIPFPKDLKKAYQAFTKADISALRRLGYTAYFHTLEEGLEKYYSNYSRECEKMQL